MNKLTIVFATFLCLQSVAYAEHLDQLLDQVKQTQTQESRLNKSREAEFIADKAKQQHLLSEAKAKLARQEQRSQQLKKQFEANEQKLGTLETELNNRSGILKELFAVARQAAGDLKADLDNSLVSAQFPQRTEKLSALADSKALPTIEQLETLWFSLQHEMTESGKVVVFNTDIESASGEPKPAKVVRIGVFNALADGQYLNYSVETNKLVELARQPDSKYLNMAEDIVETSEGTADIGIDPTRGVILSMLIQTPDIFERIDQGGFIGYIILSLGLAGFVFAIIRLFNLVRTHRQMVKQMQQSTISNDNPLGRVINAAEQANAEDSETLELVLDDAITREIPELEKGLSMIKLLAGVAPLLGLLGTVTGMIATFQSISLFGTGDPKLMASGISQALVTTMLGLCIAIPLLFLHSLLASRSRIASQILDEQSAGIISRRAGK